MHSIHTGRKNKTKIIHKLKTEDMSEVRYNTIQLDSLLLEIEYSFSEGESATNDYPGSAPEVEVLSIFVAGQEITNIIDPRYIEEIEETLTQNNF